jgi:transposase-like protein
MSKTATKPQLIPECTEESAPRRRTFTAEYKARVLDECDAAAESGESIGAILRREGLYSSILSDWRKARAEGGEAALSRTRGRPPLDPTVKAQRKEIDRLQRENAALKEQLRRLEIIQDAQKKLAELLAPLGSPTNGSAA